jgi:PIN like domain
VVRFYVDADTLGLAHALVRLRGDVTFPGDPGGTFKRTTRPPCPITRVKTPDTEWLPIVAVQGWLVITRDQHLRQRRAEIAAILDSGAKVVTIVGSSAKERLDTFSQLEILMINWRGINELVDVPGPFVYTASRSGLTEVASTQTIAPRPRKAKHGIRARPRRPPAAPPRRPRR